jgi:hypothetical protein
MAKGQKKSNREVRKPKQAKPAAATSAQSFLAGGKSSDGAKKGH